MDGTDVNVFMVVDEAVDVVFWTRDQFGLLAWRILHII